MVEKEKSKTDWLREQREARFARNQLSGKPAQAIATEDVRQKALALIPESSGTAKGTLIAKGPRINTGGGMVARPAVRQEVGADRLTPPKPKRGRPRIGEERAKPWLHCKPPMSKTTWYRRQKEQKND